VEEEALAAELRAQGVRYAAAQYWLSYRLGFLFHEDPVVVPLDAAADRYRPYRDMFERSPRAALRPDPGARPEPVEAELKQAGERYRRLEVSGFTILIVER
jgi:hypothetical protein